MLKRLFKRAEKPQVSPSGRLLRAVRQLPYGSAIIETVENEETVVVLTGRHRLRIHLTGAHAEVAGYDTWNEHRIVRGLWTEGVGWTTNEQVYGAKRYDTVKGKLPK